ncbi:MAG: ABC transporter permease [bacterium]|nr:ABC transporter permease [bacterium]
MTGFVGSILEAWDEIRIHRLRVSLSLLAVSLAITVMTATLALGQQMAQATQEASERWGGRSVTLFAEAWAEDTTKQARVTEAMEDFADRYEITHHSRVLRPWGEFSTRAGRLDWIELMAVDPAYATIHRIEPVRGTWFGEGDVQRLAPAVVVNETFLQTAGVPTDGSVQPDLVMHSQSGGKDISFVVIGVIEDGNQWASPQAYMLYDSLMAGVSKQEQGNWGAPTFEFWLSAQDAATAQTKLQSELQPLVGQFGNVNVYPGSQMGGGEDFFGGIRTLILGIGIAVLVLGAVSLVNVSLVTVQQRVREIGIRRSFGAASGRVFFSIMMESVVGTFLAGVVGVALAIVALRYLPVMQWLQMPVQDTPPFPMGAAVQGILAATGIGALAGLLPGLFATRIRPIEAMRA